MVSASVYFKLFLSIPCRTPTTPPRAFCRREYEGSSTHARYDVMPLQTSCSDLGGVRSSPHPGGVRSWPPQISEVCGVRLTLVECGVGLPRGSLGRSAQFPPPKGKGRGVRRCAEFRPEAFRLSGGVRSSSIGDVRRLTSDVKHGTSNV